MERILAVGKASIHVQELAAQAKRRFAMQLLRQQVNIDATVQEALGYQPEAVSNEPVDPDWVSRFFHTAEDVSDPMMRTICAKLLAGEVAQPGTFSRRALSVVQDMSAAEAQLFEKASSLFWFHESPPLGAFIPWRRAEDLDRFLNFDEAMILQGIGLLQFDPFISVTFSKGSVLRWQRHQVRLRQDLKVGGFMATPPARELSRIFTVPVPADPYLPQRLQVMGGAEPQLF